MGASVWDLGHDGAVRGTRGWGVLWDMGEV